MAELLGLRVSQARRPARSITSVEANFRSPRTSGRRRRRKNRLWTQLWLTDCSTHVKIGPAVDSTTKPQRIVVKGPPLSRQSRKLDPENSWHFFTQVRYQRGENQFSNAWTQLPGDDWEKTTSIRKIKNGAAFAATVAAIAAEKTALATQVRFHLSLAQKYSDEVNKLPPKMREPPLELALWHHTQIETITQRLERTARLGWAIDDWVAEMIKSFRRTFGEPP